MHKSSIPCQLIFIFSRSTLTLPTSISRLFYKARGPVFKVHGESQRKSSMSNQTNTEVLASWRNVPVVVWAPQPACLLLTAHQQSLSSTSCLSAGWRQAVSEANRAQEHRCTVGCHIYTHKVKAWVLLQVKVQTHHCTQKHQIFPTYTC